MARVEFSCDALALRIHKVYCIATSSPPTCCSDADGTVWVTDFGLERILGRRFAWGVDQASLTRTGDIVGTLRYMAPELLIAVPIRAAISKLGATLYELLTLRAAFDEADRNVFMRRLLLDEPRGRAVSIRTIPIDLETIVVKSMSKEPEDRYGSDGAELAEDLRRFLADRPMRATHFNLGTLLEKLAAATR